MREAFANNNTTSAVKMNMLYDKCNFCFYISRVIIIEVHLYVLPTFSELWHGTKPLWDLQYDTCYAKDKTTKHTDAWNYSKVS